MGATKQNSFSMLKRSGIYQRVRASSAYDLYLTLTNRPLIEEPDREIAFYRDLLDRFQTSDLIFDIGANIGDKAGTFLRL